MTADGGSAARRSTASTSDHQLQELAGRRDRQAPAGKTFSRARDPNRTSAISVPGDQRPRLPRDHLADGTQATPIQRSALALTPTAACPHRRVRRRHRGPTGRAPLAHRAAPHSQRAHPQAISRSSCATSSALAWYLDHLSSAAEAFNRKEARRRRAKWKDQLHGRLQLQSHTDAVNCRKYCTLASRLSRCVLRRPHRRARATFPFYLGASISGGSRLERVAQCAGRAVVPKQERRRAA